MKTDVIEKTLTNLFQGNFSFCSVMCMYCVESIQALDRWNGVSPYVLQPITDEELELVGFTKYSKSILSTSPPLHTVTRVPQTRNQVAKLC